MYFFYKQFPAKNELGYEVENVLFFFKVHGTVRDLHMHAVLM